MTVALGLLAKGGIVLAADTLESVPGYWKLNRGKITGCLVKRFMPTHCRIACFVSGAGNSRYIDTLSEEVRGAIAKSELTTLGQVEDTIRSIVKEFHLNHVAPFLAEIPQVQMIIAVQCEEVNGLTGHNEMTERLWTSEKSAVASYRSFATVGIGESYAASILTPLWKPDLDIHAAVTLAAYVIFRTKEFIEGCGKFTDIWYVHNLQFKQVSRSQVANMEQVYAEYFATVEPGIAWYMFGAAGTVPLDLLHSMRERIATLLASETSEPEP